MSKHNNTKTSFVPIDPKIYTLKKGIIFGAIGGFVASICFAGLILCMSVLFKYPEGAFFDTMGILINNYNNNVVSIGLSALVIIFVHGIIIGIILGIIMSKMLMFHPSNKKKGALFGLIAGLISFLVLYFPMIYISTTYQNLLSKLLSIMTNSTYMFTRGTGQMNSSIITNHMPTSNMLLWGLLTYLIYGFIAGGIITLSYSIYNFDYNEVKETKETKTVGIDRAREIITIERRPVADNARSFSNESSNTESDGPVESRTEISIPLKREEPVITKKPYVNLWEKLEPVITKKPYVNLWEKLSTRLKKK